MKSSTRKPAWTWGSCTSGPPAVKRADYAFKERMADFQQQDASKAEKLDNCHVASCWAYEQQGFINGFRLGMKLAEELRDKA